MFKKYLLLALVLFAALGFFEHYITPYAMAQDTTTPDPSTSNDPAADQEPAFKNAAEAQRVANMVEALSQETDPAVEGALSALETAEQNLQNAIASGDPGAIAAAQEQLAIAQQNMTTAMAELAATNRNEIMEMRVSGLGWGQIAHLKGLDPKVLGLGRNKKNRAGQASTEENITEISNEELTEVTQRSINKNWKSAKTNSSGKKATGTTGLTASGASTSSNSNAGGNSSNSNAGGNSGNSNAGGNSGNSNAGGNSGNSNAGGNSGNSNAGGNGNGNSNGHR
jgi:hypothetical protein